MKKLITVLALLCAGTIASATPTTITFKGSDIIGPALSGNPTGTPMIGDGRVDSPTGSIRTYWTPTATSPNPAGFDLWISSFDGTQGISGFNLWLQDGASNQAAMWGETLALTDPYSSAITPFASSGWTASIYTVGDEWGSWWKGRNLICYTANSSADYLRTGTTVEFGFTADVMGNNGATGPIYQIWVGAGSDGIVSSNGASSFQRAVAASVPDSGSLLTILLGLGSLFLFRRHRV